MAEGQQTNDTAATSGGEGTPTAAPVSAAPATQAASQSQPPAPTPLPPMSTAPRPAPQQAPAPQPPAHAGSEKSLFPNSLPVRQSLPSIHSFGASHSPMNAGPYGDSRARSAGTESKGATPSRFTASPSPYNPLPSLSNTGSPKLAAPTSATSQGAPHTSASPRLPGLTKLSPPAPAAVTLPTSSASPVSSSYRNPMSVSSMLSGPSRDRPYGSVSSTVAASGAGASPQPPVLPPAPSAHGGARKEEPKHENGKAASPPANSAIGGFRRPAEGSASPAAKSGGQGRPAGGEKGSMSPAGAGGAAGGDKDASGNSAANKAERSYPPLPSAFARESPYSTWAGSSKKDQGFGARHDSASSKEGSPPASQGGAPKQAGKTFFPSINNSFSRPPASTSTRRHSNSVPGGPSFPPTFPWTAATLQQQQQQQAHQQQAQQPQQQQQQQGASSVRSYPDFYHTNSTDSLRAQEEKRKAEAASASHHSHSSSAQQQQHRQGASQPHQSGKAHVRYPGSDSYSSLGGRAGTSAPTTHVSATQDMPSWRTPESGATSINPVPLNSSTLAHKRRRSEGVQSGLRQEGGFADGKPKVVKTPFVPPFSLTDQRKATVRPPLLSVRNEEVLKALARPFSPSTDTDADAKAPKRPFLGRIVYDPFVNPATLLDGQLLRSNVGGVVEVAISTGWFESSPFLSTSTSSSDAPPSLPSTLYEFGDPATYDGSPLSDPTADESDPRIPPSVWELEGIRKRKVWGSDVYTDDSDVLALLLHSGWLRLGRRKLAGKRLVAGEKGAGDQAVKASRTPWKGFGGEGEGEKKQEGVKSLIVKLVVAPRLVRYQGCERMGIKSRSWGNGHDGVSLMVESVDLVDELLRPHGRRWTKWRLGDLVDSLLPRDIAAPPSTVDVVLPRDGSSTPDDGDTLSVVDTFVLGPRKEDCSFVRKESSPVLANGSAAAEEAMEVDEV